MQTFEYSQLEVACSRTYARTDRIPDLEMRVRYHAEGVNEGVQRHVSGGPLTAMTEISDFRVSLLNSLGSEGWQVIAVGGEDDSNFVYTFGRRGGDWPSIDYGGLIEECVVGVFDSSEMTSPVERRGTRQRAQRDDEVRVSSLGVNRRSRRKRTIVAFEEDFGSGLSPDARARQARTIESFEDEFETRSSPDAEAES